MVVPMTAVNHILILELRITARDLCHDIGRVNLTNLVRNLKPGLCPKWDGPETGFGSGGMKSIPILSSGSEQFRSLVELNQRLGLHSFPGFRIAKNHVFTTVVLKQVRAWLCSGRNQNDGGSAVI